MSRERLNLQSCHPRSREFATTGLESHVSHEGLNNFSIKFFHVASAIKIPDNVPIYRYFSAFPPLLLIWLELRVYFYSSSTKRILHAIVIVNFLKTKKAS